MSARTVAVTGASGFVGGFISLALAEAGHHVIALGRHPVTPYEHRDYALSTPIADGLLADVATVIHCAYDLKLTGQQSDRGGQRGGDANPRGRCESWHKSHPRVDVCLSWDEAGLRPGQAALRAVRLGLVWGGFEGGMIGTLKRLAGLPVAPTFGLGVHQFTVHADDVGAGFVKLVEHPRFGEPLGLAHPVAVAFERILGELGDGRRRDSSGYPGLRFTPR